jgi:lysophospholipase L1-like esterase
VILVVAIGLASAAPTAAPAAAAGGGAKAIVLGDSTAAGVGYPLVAAPSALDRACRRSADSYAVALGRLSHSSVRNLACSGATIADGVLGSQKVGGQVVPPQLGVAEQTTGVSVVALSIGADDVGWSAVIELCALSQDCADQAATDAFQSNLTQFTDQYDDLLRQLTTLRGHPLVLVNMYYDPFGPDPRCLEPLGLTPAKVKVLVTDLNALNAVLARGAQGFGFVPVHPNFSGHQVCSNQPDVQTMTSSAPLHPTVSGALRIARADEQAISAHHR